MKPAWLGGALILALTFAAGTAAGVGYERHVASTHLAPSPPLDAQHVLQHMKLLLGLDSAQTAAIATILAHHQHAVDSSWHAMQPQVRANLDSTMREIMTVLKPDQVTRFREFVHVMHPGMLP